MAKLCPYYKGKNPYSYAIGCYPTSIGFKSPAERDDYVKIFCESDYQKCREYKWKERKR